MTDPLQARVSRVKALFMDVDGILTDGSIYVGPGELELKRFTVEDGVGRALARQADLPLALISGRSSEATTARARQLKIEEVYQGFMNKLEPFEILLDKFGIGDHEVAYIGDGFIDLPVMERVGVPVSVPTAHPLVKSVAVYITERMGGQGVLREVVEWILTYQGRFNEVVANLRAELHEVSKNE
ncbi:MAG: HAD hydrolase family protein [Fidelibacterota bacterium]|nr:MAG: HAD hydrolase family protein [Candidatus Neomarinimicrobiota bacterium]